MRFNPEFAHNWDTRIGAAEVVFMAWKGYGAGGEAKAIGRTKTVADGSQIDRLLESKTIGTKPKPEADQKRAQFLADMEELEGRKLTEQEANLWIAQAEDIGDL